MPILMHDCGLRKLPLGTIKNNVKSYTKNYVPGGLPGTWYTLIETN